MTNKRTHIESNLNGGLDVWLDQDRVVTGDIYPIESLEFSKRDLERMLALFKPTGYDRVKKWRENNKGKYNTYMRDYMRKKRGQG